MYLLQRYEGPRLPRHRRGQTCSPQVPAVSTLLLRKFGPTSDMMTTLIWVKMSPGSIYMVSAAIPSFLAFHSLMNICDGVASCLLGFSCSQPPSTRSLRPTVNAALKVLVWLKVTMLCFWPVFRFLYKQLVLFSDASREARERCIFESCAGSSLLRLKPGITLHLYTNQPPDGTIKKFYTERSVVRSASRRISDLCLVFIYCKY